MKKLIIVITLLIFTCLYVETFGDDFSKNHFYFQQNNGQILNDRNEPCWDINYVIRTREMDVYLKKNSISYVIKRTYNNKEKVVSYISELLPNFTQEFLRYDVEFVNSNKNVEIISDDSKNTNLRFYNQITGSTGIDVSTHRYITYRNIYDNIDLIFYTQYGNLKYDFVVKKGGNVDYIKLKYTGCNVEKSDNNKLLIHTKLGDIHESIPKSTFEGMNGEKSDIMVLYNINNNYINFTAPINTDFSEIIIDPEIEWSTYFGGGSDEFISGVGTDNDGNVYITGTTSSINYPTTTGAYQKIIGGNSDIFLNKISQTGEHIWGTYIGGSGRDGSYHVVTKKGRVWISGETRGGIFPTTADAFQKNFSGGLADGIIVKFSDNGELIYSSIYGNKGYNPTIGIDIDDSGNCWYTGRTTGCSFPVSDDALQSSCGGGYDAFILKFSPVGERLYASYLGGSQTESGEGITTDFNGNVVISGFTESTDFQVTENAFQKKNGGVFDAFLIKLNNTGHLIWSSYFGGNNNDYGSNITTDNNGNFIVHGISGSTNLPTNNDSYQKLNAGGLDSYIAKFTQYGQLTWMTYFGGIGHEAYDFMDHLAGGIDVNSANDIAISGFTKSNNFPTTLDAISRTLSGSQDAYITIFNKDGNLLYSSYLGGNANDRGRDVIFTPQNYLVNVGETNSLDFTITNNALYQKNNGNYDGYIIKLSFSDCDYRSFNFENFNSTEKINFVGDAQKMDTTITITSPINWTNGAIWYDDKIPVKLGFQTNFSFRFSDGVDKYIPEDYPGADGICFILQNSDAKTIGSMGGGLGFKGIKNSLVVEFDTYKNTSEGIDDFNDPNENHVAVFCNGTNPIIPDHESNANLATNDSIMPLVPDGRVFFAKIEYELGEFFKVYLDTVEIEGQLPIIEIKGTDLSQLLDLKCGDFVWVGFSSATGNAYERHELLNWSMCAKPSGARVPNPQIKIGKDTVCENSIESYSSNISSNTSYNWNVSGGIINSGQGTGNVEIKWGNNPYGKLTLIHTLNSEGCSDTISKDIFIITKPEFGLSGSENLCIDQMGTYHAKKYDNYNYKWVTDEGEIIGNDTGDSVNIVWHEPGNFNLKLIMNHDFCDISGNVNKTVNVYNLPQITFDIIEDICINDPPFTLNIAKPKGGTYYGNGITSNIIFPKEAGVGTHEIIYSYQDPDFGCKNSASIQINILPAPAKPEIKYQFGKMLSSNSNFGNQWYLDGVKIDGANNQIYKPETSGTFTVKVIGENGCESESSNPYDFDITGIDEKFNNTYINIIPNPFTGTTTISFSLLRPGKVNITITDIMGKEIAKPLQKQFLEAGEHSIEFDAIELPAGVYICFLRAETYSQTVKMMVIK